MEFHDFAPLSSPLFIPNPTLFQLADVQMETADTPVSMSSVTNGVQGTIAVSSDNFAVSGLSHHVMSTMTSPSPMVASQEIESNPDILKAELSFYNTSHIKDYEEVVYSTLKSIESTCAGDFASMCAGSGDAAWPAIDRISFGINGRKTLGDAQSLSRSGTAVGRDTVSNIESIMVKQQGEQGDNEPKIYNNLRGKNDLIRPELSRIFSDIDKKSWDHKRETDHMERKGKDGGKHHEEHHVPPHPNEEHHNPDGSWVPSSRDKENSDDKRNHHHHNDHNGRRGPPHSRPKEDYLFVGSLGYGEAGDKCMYQNFQKLAAPCQSSVADLHSLRRQYLKEESTARHRPDGSVLFIIGLIFYVSFKVGMELEYTHHRCLSKEKDTSAITVTDADPALKAQCKSYLLLVLVD